jgi:hypothetical protein
VAAQAGNPVLFPDMQIAGYKSRFHSDLTAKNARYS